MESLFLLIPVALVFCAAAIRLLLWAIDDGQYDDLDREGWRILDDDDELSQDDERPAAKSRTGGPAGRGEGDR